MYVLISQCSQSENCLLPGADYTRREKSGLRDFRIYTQHRLGISGRALAVVPLSVLQREIIKTLALATHRKLFILRARACLATQSPPPPNLLARTKEAFFCSSPGRETDCFEYLIPSHSLSILIYSNLSQWDLFTVSQSSQPQSMNLDTGIKTETVLLFRKQKHIHNFGMDI